LRFESDPHTRAVFFIGFLLYFIQQMPVGSLGASFSISVGNRSLFILYHWFLFAIALVGSNQNPSSKFPEIKNIFNEFGGDNSSLITTYKTIDFSLKY
jgi:hypothetical protein